jgi:conjugal transfer pilus assembly protein TraK
MRNARLLVPALIVALLSLPGRAQVSTTAPPQPIGQPPAPLLGTPKTAPAPTPPGAAGAMGTPVPVPLPPLAAPAPTPSPLQKGLAEGAARAATAAKEAAATATGVTTGTTPGAGANTSTLPEAAVPTFVIPSKNTPAPPPASPAGTALRLSDPNAPLTSPVSGAVRVVPAAGGPLAPGVAQPPAPAPVAAPGAPGASAAATTTRPTGMGTSTTTSSVSSSGGGVVVLPGTSTGAGTGDSGLPATPSFPPAPLVNDLPGLGRAPGTQQPGKALVVRSVAGVNDIVPVSRNFPNRIATPFLDPVWVDQGTANIEKLHGSVFVIPKSDRAIQLFLTEANDPNAPVVQMTLLPRAIPGQTIILQIEGQDSQIAARRAAQQQQPTRDAQMPDEYTNQLLFLLREVARGRPPAGYTEELLSVPVATLPGDVQVLPDRRYSGTTYDIFRYRIRNAGAKQVTLQEQSFFAKGVRAVAFFPLLQLAAGQETVVHIIASKDGE